MKKVCFTFIFGDYDDLKEPSIISEGWEYICFSDRPRKSKTWRIIEVKKDDLPNPRKARLVLTCPFLFIDYDIALSVGGQIQVRCDLNKYIDNEFTVLKHPDRDCVYQEAEACIKRKKDDRNTILKQIEKYRKLKYPKNHGMIATGLIIRKNTNEINNFCLDWYEELSKHSFRDQLSFNFIAWKKGFEYKTLPFDLLYSDFELNKHK
jgi:hypothetical protein